MGDRPEKYKLFAVSFGEALIIYSKDAKRQKDSSLGTAHESFATGYLSGFHRIITLMQQQAEIFDIPLSELGIDIDENNLI